MPGPRYDLVCVGAGIVGLATALALTRRTKAKIAVIEAEREPATHQTGHNSGVIHSGLYYAPKSRKARNCVEGRRRLLALCDQHGIDYELCGKLVIATNEPEIAALEELERRGRANGLAGIERVDRAEIERYEPHAVGRAALWIPETGIIDYRAVAGLLARLVEESGATVSLGHRLLKVQSSQTGLVLETTEGAIETSALINCAGLQSDRVARQCGADPQMRIVPFRGEYFDLAPDRRQLLRGLIYPVPDPRFPFLGVHLTRRIDGSVEAGPNAVLALHREGYGAADRIRLRDAWSALSYPGLWRLGARYWRVGLSEYVRSGNSRRFAAALQRFVPEIREQDLVAGGCGIRAQALDRRGRMLDDFVIERSPRALHVLNAPSPAATASLAIGDDLCAMAVEDFELPLRQSKRTRQSTDPAEQRTEWSPA